MILMALCGVAEIPREKLWKTISAPTEKGEKMAEYIEREALIADIEKRYCQPCEAEGKDCNHVRCLACWVDDMVGEIGEAPFYDVSPVVHGEWNMDGKNHCHCSCCSSGRNIETQIGWNFCPNCGADMRERKGDDAAD
jgi:hypothetical protein